MTQMITAASIVPALGLAIGLALLSCNRSAAVATNLKGDTRCFQADSLPDNAPPYPAIPTRFVLDSAVGQRVVRARGGAVLDSVSWARPADGVILVTWRPEVLMRFPSAGGNAMISWGDAAIVVQIRPCK
ncbi:MAG: hypothetical protein M3R07_09100 [Gemmatimonadota bacterium]|nr:hypothetical protein [Gemmatimonadota bacterium]